MAAFEDNFIYSDYVSNDGRSYSIRTLASFQADTTNNGLSLTSTYPLYGKQTRRRHVRYGVYADLTAVGRKVKVPFASAALFNTAEASLGTTPLTISRRVRGEVAAKTYTLVAMIPEKVPAHTIQSSAAQGT